MNIAFLFRRDLRLEDNTGLIAALQQGSEVYPVFIFDDKQVDATINDYFGNNSFRFMLESLADLSNELTAKKSSLTILKGDYCEEILKFCSTQNINKVIVNRDYTPFARERDKKLAEVLNRSQIQFESYDDLLLSRPEDVLTAQGSYYSVFSPFARNAMSQPVRKVTQLYNYNKLSNYSHPEQTDLIENYLSHYKDESTWKGGRSEGIILLNDISDLGSYRTIRNIPSVGRTSHLSPHHKFGTLSIRETYWTALKFQGIGSKLIKELYWRDFYTHGIWHRPELLQTAYLDRDRFIPWRYPNQDSEANKDFELWKRGETGIPLVDAGMRELLQTGWMHNRVRMVVASFLTKNLLIDWRDGARHFAQYLVDYDPAVNAGNWQWSASVGMDPKPLRIFNPYLQAKKFDPQAHYIKTYVPELKDVEVQLLVDGKERDFSSLFDSYVPPIVSHKDTSRRAREVYKQANEEAKVVKEL